MACCNGMYWNLAPRSVISIYDQYSFRSLTNLIVVRLDIHVDECIYIDGDMFENAYSRQNG